jgi:hypothetical protein
MVMSTANSLGAVVPFGLAGSAERVRPSARVDGGRLVQGDRQQAWDSPQDAYQDGQPPSKTAVLTAVGDVLEDGGRQGGHSRQGLESGKTADQRLLSYHQPIDATAEAPTAVRTGQVVDFPKTPQSRPPDFLSAQPATYSAAQAAAQAAAHSTDTMDFVQPALLAQMISQNDRSPRLNIEPFRQTASLYARQQTPTPALSALDIRI